MVLDNPWDVQGDSNERNEQGVRRLRADFLKWQEDKCIPHSRRIGDLTVSMLGDRRKANSDTKLHPGSLVKTKAAETRIIMEFTLDRMKTIGTTHFNHDLIMAGEALVKYAAIMSSCNDTVVAFDDQRQLMDLIVDALSRMQRARVQDVPKFHATIHMTSRHHRALQLCDHTAKLVDHIASHVM